MIRPSDPREAELPSGDEMTTGDEPVDNDLDIGTVREGPAEFFNLRSDEVGGGSTHAPWNNGWIAEMS